MRTVKTTSGATAVQVVWSSRRGSREIEHLGSAHEDAELQALKAAAQPRIAAGQLELSLGLEPMGGGPLPITSSRMGHLLDALEHAERNRFIALDGAVKSINRDLEAKARDLAGTKGYRTNIAACPDGTPVTADFVIGSYHRLFEIEKSFRMSKSDLQARPIYHRKRDSIEAHLTIVFAAWRSAAGSRHRQAGPSGNSSRRPADIAPSRSRPDSRPSPPPTRYPTNSAKPSKPSLVAAEVRTSLSQLGSSPRTSPRTLHPRRAALWAFCRFLAQCWGDMWVGRRRGRSGVASCKYSL